MAESSDSVPPLKEEHRQAHQKALQNVGDRKLRREIELRMGAENLRLQREAEAIKAQAEQLKQRDPETSEVIHVQEASLEAVERATELRRMFIENLPNASDVPISAVFSDDFAATAIKTVDDFVSYARKVNVDAIIKGAKEPPRFNSEVVRMNEYFAEQRSQAFSKLEFRGNELRPLNELGFKNRVLARLNSIPGLIGQPVGAVTVLTERDLRMQPRVGVAFMDAITSKLSGLGLSLAPNDDYKSTFPSTATYRSKTDLF